MLKRVHSVFVWYWLIVNTTVERHAVMRSARGWHVVVVQGTEDMGVVGLGEDSRTSGQRTLCAQEVHSSDNSDDHDDDQSSNTNAHVPSLAAAPSFKFRGRRALSLPTLLPCLLPQLPTPCLWQTGIPALDGRAAPPMASQRIELLHCVVVSGAMQVGWGDQVQGEPGPKPGRDLPNLAPEALDRTRR